jgi:hypothetical protein
MPPKATKRFSNVRYWRYVFTPILLLVLAFGIFMLYTTDISPAVLKPKSPELPSSGFLSSLNSLRKLGSR